MSSLSFNKPQAQLPQHWSEKKYWAKTFESLFIPRCVFNVQNLRRLPFQILRFVTTLCNGLCEMFSTGTGRCGAQMYLLAWVTKLKTGPSQTAFNRNEPCLWQSLRTPPWNDRTLNIPPYLALRRLDEVINFKQGDKLKTYQTPSGQDLSSSFPTTFFINGLVSRRIQDNMFKDMKRG